MPHHEAEVLPGEDPASPVSPDTSQETAGTDDRSPGPRSAAFANNDGPFAHFFFYADQLLPTHGRPAVPPHVRWSRGQDLSSAPPARTQARKVGTHRDIVRFVIVALLMLVALVGVVLGIAMKRAVGAPLPDNGTAATSGEMSGEAK